MSGEWTDITWFTEDDIDSNTKGGSDTGGSGSTPPIDLTDTYYVRTENNHILVDENGLAYSIEGI